VTQCPAVLLWLSQEHRRGSSGRKPCRWWGEAPERDRLQVYILSTFARLKRQAAWPSRGLGVANSLGVSLSLRLELGWFGGGRNQFGLRAKKFAQPVRHATSPARPCCFACRQARSLREDKPATGYDLEPRPTERCRTTTPRPANLPPSPA
jgi:hypothetical protein